MVADILMVAAVVAGLVWVHRLAVVRRDLRVLSVTLFFDLVVGVLIVVAAANTPLYKDWMQEDNWAEWATFFAFFGAGFAAVVALKPELKIEENNIGRALTIGGALGFAGFCFFVAGEEISWAQRLLAFKPPDIFLEKNFQQELNVHNLLKGETLLGFKLESKYLVAVIAICYGVLAPVVVMAVHPKGLLGQLAH